MSFRTLAATLTTLCLLLAAVAPAVVGSAPGAGAELRAPTVLVFGLGSRCRYCVELKKQIGQVTAETGDAVRFQDIRVDQDRVMVERYRVVLSPTLVFLDAAGAEVFRHQGILDAAQIRARLVALGFWPRKG